jgi:hypothetical protein
MAVLSTYHPKVIVFCNLLNCFFRIQLYAVASLCNFQLIQFKIYKNTYNTVYNFMLFTLLMPYFELICIFRVEIRFRNTFHHNLIK